MSTDYSFGDGAKYIIRKNMRAILDATLEDIMNFKQPNNLKVKSLSVLYYLIKACGSQLEPFCDKILNSLYGRIDEDEEIIKQCENIANILGLTIDQGILIPLMIKHINELESKHTYQPLNSRLKILSNILQKITNISSESVSMILKGMQALDLFNMPDNPFVKPILSSLHLIYKSLIFNLENDCVKFHSDLFLPLLLLQSLPESKEIHKEVKITMEKLSENCGFHSLEDLFSLELQVVLDKFKDSHLKWNKNSPDRFAFDTYTKNGGAALEKHWIDILNIISHCTEAVKDLEIRMDMVCLMENLIENKEVNEQLKPFMEFIVPEILLPCCAWKSQRPSYKVRKASLVCLIKIFKYGLIDEETSIGFFKEFMNVLKQALDDDWDPEIRFLSIKLMKEFCLINKNSFNEENMFELYPVLLKRLDDSQDANRIEMCGILEVYFQICQRVKVSESTYDYIINTSFIHLDDPNEIVRDAVFGFLKEALKVYPETFKKIANKNLHVFTHGSLIHRLLESLN